MRDDRGRTCGGDLGELMGHFGMVELICGGGGRMEGLFGGVREY